LKAMPPERISAAGYAEFHPVADNDTADGRAENRRVDLVVLPHAKVDLSGPPNPASSGPWRRITGDK
jgi:chemotaxis protein MotB